MPSAEGIVGHRPAEPLSWLERRSLPPMLRSLRHRNFRLFFVGQLISLIGTWMQTVAQSWLIYRLTGSSLLLGTVGFASQFPVFLLAPLGGIVADRFPRHRVVITTQTLLMVQAFLFALLTLAGWIRTWEIIVLAAVQGTVNAFDVPGRQAFLIEMVSREDLMNAIALNSSMFNAARIIGPALAGALVAAIGEGWCFFANGVSFLAVLASLLVMRLERVRPSEAAASAWQAVAEGFAFARQAAPIRALLLLIGLVSLVAMPYTVLMPIFADRILGGGASGLGVLMAATGVGALAGALTLAARKGVRGLGRWVATSAAAFGVSLILFAFSRSFWLSFLLLVPTGFTMMVETASTNTLLQAMTPDRLRGRIMALYSMMFMGLAPFGALLAGALADRIGAPWTVASGGFACLLGAGLFARRLPVLREQAVQLFIAQGVAGGEPVEELTVPRRDF